MTNLLGLSIEELIKATGLSEEELVAKCREQNQKRIKTADPGSVIASVRRTFKMINAEATSDYVVGCLMPAIESVMKAGIIEDRDEAFDVILGCLRVMTREAMATIFYTQEKGFDEDYVLTDEDTYNIKLKYKELFGITQEDDERIK